ncbi:MAG: glycosyltransferase family 2 protein [Candidatus Stahlbacteria bacterium]|nr:glycosyltransferase family 2 protein [Candidatus Stahlbacteria bacterium]
MKVALLIPVYNEEKTIGKLIQSLNYPSRSIGISAPDTFCVGTGPLQHKDIIIVDDGSIDSTFKVVKDMGAIVLRHTSNLGKGQAHRTGFKYALQQGYDYVITLDGDGQHLPNEMCRFLDIIEKTRKDIIIGETIV